MIQRKAMEKNAKYNVPDVSKVQKGATVASWGNSMRFFLSKVPSAWGIATMSYVTTKEAQVPIVDLTLAPDQPHSLEHGLVEDEYENCLLHSDVRFRNNNWTVFGYLKEATRGTTFAPFIKTFKRTSNGSMDGSKYAARWGEQLDRTI